MEHHRCFWVYIIKTQATRNSHTVFFKHQYITHSTVTPECHVVATVLQLTIALQENIPAGNKASEALQKVRKLFIKIAMAKNKAANTKAKHNKVWATQAA
jgi:hypothetical protein